MAFLHFYFFFNYFFLIFFWDFVKQFDKDHFKKFKFRNFYVIFVFIYLLIISFNCRCVEPFFCCWKKNPPLCEKFLDPPITEKHTPMKPIHSIKTIPYVIITTRATPEQPWLIIYFSHEYMPILVTLHVKGVTHDTQQLIYHFY